MSLAVKPFITVIMPCYNGEKYLEKSLEAFFSQDYPNKKLVVVDGKSTDQSHCIIAGFVAKGCPLIWDKTPDEGISNAINIGLRHLKEEDVFGFLGSDDILMPNILSEVAYLFYASPNIDGLYFDSFNYFVGSGKLSYRKCPTSDFSLKNLLKFGTIAGLQNIYIKASHVVANEFSEKNKYSMDYDLYIRLAKSGISNMTHLSKPSSVNLMHENISTKFVFEGAAEAINAAVEHVGYTPSLLRRIFLLKLVKIKHILLRSYENL